jgi:thymidine kinase
LISLSIGRRKTAAMADLDRMRTDRLAFAKAIGMPLAAWQNAALRLRKRITVIAAPRQSGKSRSLTVLGLHRAYTEADHRVLLVSASEDAAKRLLAAAARIATSSPLLAGSVVDENSGLLVLSNGSELRSVPQSERAVRGWSVDTLLIDEAAQLDDDFVLGACLPTVAARPNARVVLTGSPGDQAGVFYEHHRLGVEGSAHVEAFSWSLEQATWIAPGTIASARESMPAAVFEREFLGRFSEAGLEEAVIPRAWVEAAQRRTLAASGGAVYGLDVARLGSDSTVCVRACSGVVRTVWTVHGADLMQVCGKMAATLNDAPARVWVDATGLGAGVLDRLRELGYDAGAWVAAARARNPARFVNVKAESWWNAREQFRQELVDLDPGDRTLAGQTASVRYGLTSSGQIQIIAKRDTAGPSPDHADAAVIALHGARGGDTLTLHVARGLLPTHRLGMTRADRIPRLPLRGLPAWQRRIVAEQLRR